jgi:hypothetical protein
MEATLARKLQVVKNRGAMYKAFTVGDYTTKLTRVFAELERLDMTADERGYNIRGIYLKEVPCKSI